MKKITPRENHQEQLERWAQFVRDNPTKWKKHHTKFINALFEKNQQFMQRLLKTPHGKEKIIQLYEIKNKEGYPFLK